MTALTVGKLAKLTDTSTVTLRYYERIGLLPEVQRSKGGYRLYPEEHVDRIKFIQKAKSFGFELQEIQELLELHEMPCGPSAPIREKVKEKLVDVKQRAKDLETLESSLTQLLDLCDGKLLANQCPIIEHLYQEKKHK